MIVILMRLQCLTLATTYSFTKFFTPEMSLLTPPDTPDTAAPFPPAPHALTVNELHAQLLSARLQDAIRYQIGLTRFIESLERKIIHAMNKPKPTDPLHLKSFRTRLRRRGAILQDQLLELIEEHKEWHGDALTARLVNRVMMEEDWDEDYMESGLFEFSDEEEGEDAGAGNAQPGHGAFYADELDDMVMDEEDDGVYGGSPELYVTNPDILDEDEVL